MLAEVYKIIYDGPEDNFHGVIQSSDCESGGQTLFENVDIEDIEDLPSLYRERGSFKNYGKEPNISKQMYNFDVILQGPNIASISVTPSFGIYFYLFGYLYTYMKYPVPSYESASVSTPLRKEIRTEDGKSRLTVLFAVFENAAEACVKVKFTKVNSGFDLNGIIYARTSAIKNFMYKSLLFFKDNGDQLPVKAGVETPIPLSRSFVAVPVGSDLILEICLSGGDNNNNNKVVPNIVVFKCVEGLPPSYRTISCSNWEIEVQICWRYKDKWTEMEALEY